MDVSQLQALDAVARLGTFSKAARALDISQPTVTLRIQALEDTVGGPLFRRGGKQAELTELGAGFLPYARQAMAALIRGLETAHRTREGQWGRVTLGALPSLTTGFLAATVARMHASHPHLSIAIHTGHTEQVVEMLHDGFVRLGLIYWPFYRAELLPLATFREPLILVAHAGHPLARQPVITPSALIEVANPFWRVDWTAEANVWQAQLAPASGRALDVPIAMAHELVSRGIGAALLTRALVADDLAAGRLVELAIADAPTLARGCALVRLARDAELPIAVGEFARALSEEGRVFRVE